MINSSALYDHFTYGRRKFSVPVKLQTPAERILMLYKLLVYLFAYDFKWKELKGYTMFSRFL